MKVQLKTFRRHLLRYSLRTLLVLVTFVALWLGWKVNRVRNQQTAVAAIEAAGGMVRYDWMEDYYQAESAKGSVHWSAMYGGYESRSWPTLRRWIGDEYFEYVIGVWVNMSEFDEHDSNDKRWIATLNHLPKLTTLHIEDISINDHDVQHLKGLTTLQSLSLRRTGVTDSVVVQLENLVDLECLDLTGTSVSDESVEMLIGFSKLKHLWLDNTKVTRSGAEKLRGVLQHCRVFSSSD